LLFNLNQSHWSHRSFLTFKLRWNSLHIRKDNVETFTNHNELSFTRTDYKYWEIFKSKHLFSFKKWYYPLSGRDDDSARWTSLSIEHKIPDWIPLCQRKYNFKLQTCHDCQDPYYILADVREQSCIQRKSTKTFDPRI
jgi:hypothetical protein